MAPRDASAIGRTGRRGPRRLGPFAVVLAIALFGSLLLTPGSAAENPRGIPASPVRYVGGVLAGAQSVAVRPPYAYVGSSRDGAGITIVDVSNPEQPAVVGATEALTPYGGTTVLTAESDYLYVVASGTLRIMSLASPTQPVTVA